MSTEGIPKLDIHSPKHRKYKQQKSTKRSQRSQYYSPSPTGFGNSGRGRYYSPRSPAYGYDQLSSPRSSYYQPYGPACGTNFVYPKGFYENIGFPNDYLDYEPDMPYRSTERMCHDEYTLHSNTDNYGDTPRYQWKVAEHDISIKEIIKQKQIKEDMYTQTAQPQQKQTAINTQPKQKQKPKNQNPQNPKEQNRDIAKIQIKKQNTSHNINILDELENQSAEKQRDSYTFQQNKPVQPSPIKNKIISQHVIGQQPIIDSDFSHSSSFERKPNPQQYKKTFSEAILDEILEKDQKQYEQKYNSDNKYSQVIVGKMHKRVQIKQNTSNYQQIKKQTKSITNNFTENQQSNIKKQWYNKKEEENRRQSDVVDEGQRRNQMNHYRNKITNQNINRQADNTNRNYHSSGQPYQNNYAGLRKTDMQSANTNNLIVDDRTYNNNLNIEHARNTTNGHSNSRPMKVQGKKLHRQNTVSVVVNRGEDRNKHLRDSIAQTNDQSNQNSRNQVMQTDNSRNHLIFEKLVKNIINDQEFRRRINQKTDQFHKIRIQFEDDTTIQLNDLIDSKDAYVRYSKQFLQKLNSIIKDQKYTIKSDQNILKRQSAQQMKYLEVPSNKPFQIPIQRSYQAMPPQILNGPQAPPIYQQMSLQPPTINLYQNQYPGPQQNVIVSVPLGPPVVLPSQGQFYGQFAQQVMHPRPQQVQEQVTYRRSIPNIPIDLRNRMN